MSGSRPDGQIEFDADLFDLRRIRRSLVLPAANSRSPKSSFRKTIHTDHSRPAPSLKYSSFFLSEIVVHYRHPVSHEGRFAVVTDVEAGCGGRVDVAAWLIRADEQHDAHGQVAWS
jgi:hypothetical protein